MYVELIENAKKIANENFCSQTTGFSVGASLLCKSGKIYDAFNIENDGIQSICAERAAFVRALCDGEKDFEAIAIVGKYVNNKEFIKTVPCGYCRQFMMQYGGKDLTICILEDNDIIKEYKLGELLPEVFSYDKNES